MRRLVSLVPILLLLSGVPQTATAQEAHEVRITDARSDTQLRVALSNTTTVPGRAHVDLLSAWIANETEETFEVGFSLAAWEEPVYTPPHGGRQVLIAFNAGDRTYGIAVDRSGASAYCRNENQVRLVVATAFYDSPYTQGALACLQPDIEPSTGTLRVQVPKQVMSDHSKIPLVAGATISHLRAIAVEMGMALVEVYDRMPDKGAGPDFLLRKGGVEATGHLLLSTPSPSRASNGESTTMVFPLDLLNDADRDDVVALRVEHTYSGWSIRLPSDVKVPAKGQVRVPLILSMNFTHEHDTSQNLTVHATSSIRSGARATLALSVHWLSVPQPAGHHDTLWLHSRPQAWSGHPVDPLAGVAGWMNALEQDPDPRTTDEPVPAEALFLGNGVWEFPLWPDLGIGLDFDLARQGLLRVRTESTIPSMQASLAAQIIHCRRPSGGPGDGIRTCADGAETLLGGGVHGPITLAPNGVTSWEVPLSFKPQADLVPFEAGSNLILRVELQQEVPNTLYPNGRAPTPRLIVKGSQLQLPLHEYHDPIDQAFQDIGSLQVRSLTASEKSVNPGRAGMFRFEIHNSGPNAQDLTLDIEGINHEWSSLAGPREFAAPAGGSVEVGVIVRPPDDAASGERAELFLVVQSKSSPAVPALARLRATVVALDEQDVPDEAEAVEFSTGRSDIPAFTAWMVAAALLALVIRRRTR